MDLAKFQKYFRFVYFIFTLLGTSIMTYKGFFNYFSGASETISSYFHFYTYQSNLIVTIWMLYIIIQQISNQLPKRYDPLFQGAVTTYITVTFLIYAVLLSPMFQPTGFFRFEIILTHYIVPILCIVDWGLSIPSIEYKWWYIPTWLTFPLLYLAYSIIRGVIVDWYPYFFMDLTVLTLRQFTLNIFLLTMFFLLLGSIYTGGNRLIRNILERRKEEKV